jgi:hypothetical protein
LKVIFTRDFLALIPSVAVVGLVAGALMKTVGHDAVVGVLLCAALAFLLAVWWERRRIVLQAAS